MKNTRKVEYINTEFENDLLSHLRDRVFHLTPTSCYEQILRERFIFQNREERFGLNVCSENSFGRKNGWVCLFDLREKSDSEIEDALFKYDFLQPQWFIKRTAESTESHVTYLFLNPEA